MHPQQRRILYIEKPAFVGGSAIGLYELVRGLDKSLYEPIILFHRPNPHRERFQALGVKVITLNERPLVPEPVTSPRRGIAASLSRYGNRLAKTYRTAKDVYLFTRRDWPVARRVAHLIKTEGIDLVHHNNSLTGNRDTVIGAWLAGTAQVCHVRTLQGLSTLERHLARFVDTFIYMSRAIEQVYRQAGIPADQGRVIYDGFNAEAFKPINSHNGLRAEFGLTEEDRLISNVGRLDWWKGHDYFLQAMAEVIRSQPKAKALIVGEPDSTELSQSYYQRLQQLVTDLQLKEHVIFGGFRSDVAQIMAASDVVVHSSSESEPFGLVIIEAMAAGRPVVATAAGGVLDIVEDQVNGLLVPPKNASFMARAIGQLLHNPGQASLLGQRAQQYVRERFSSRQYVAGVQTVYQKILAE